MKRPASQSLRNERGTTLAEALVSAAIFAVIAAGVSSLVKTAFVTAGVNVQRNHAIAAAENRLEELRSLKFDDLIALAPTASALPSTIVRDDLTFSIATLVQPDVPANNMSQVTVTVTWNNRGLQLKHSVSTIYTEVFGGA